MALRLSLWLGLLGAASLSRTAFAEDKPTEQQIQFFEQKVRPLLIAKCYECHSSGKKIEGGLRLDTRAGWTKGGDRGPAVARGKVEESLLIRAVRYKDADLQMPPSGRLSDREIAILEEWVRRGAPDPRDDAAPAAGSGVDLRAARNHWAFQPLKATAAPRVSDTQWPLQEVDRFVLAALERNNLRPSTDADRHTWLRRVSLDLTGLPPSPEEIAAFTSDPSEAAWERVVDRLLASPAFGERWARPWLDLVGYADQIGSANNVPAEHAWRYRDYVVRSFNADKPLDQFIREQLAGDLLTAADIQERQDQITATGFLVLGNVNIVESDKLIMRMDLVDQQIEKVGKAFLGMTLNCARCHDHKFDPVTLRDYYGLAGIFASTESTYRADRGIWSSVTKAELPETLDQFTARQAALAAHERRAAELRSEREAVERRLRELESLIPAAKDTRAELEKERAELSARRDSLNRRALHLAYLRPSPPVAFAVKEAADVADARRQIRGNPHTLGETVPRGFVQIATQSAAPPIPADQSGRLQLAEWLVGDASPLTARVTINRLWQRLFSQGIVGSVDYFGLRGERPSHPELLDALALRFISDGWSQKRLIRTLVLSRTYRQASELNDASRAAQALDPDNRLLWRMKPRRLEAEMLRDAALAVSGGLQRYVGGPALVPEFPENVGGLDPTDVNPINFSLNRFRDDQPRLRTIYLPVVRSSEQRGPSDVLNLFDFTQPAQLAGSRATTTVASQSLFLLNGPLLKEAARRLAVTLLSDPRLVTDDDRIAALALRVWNRPLDPHEMADARAFVKATGTGVPHGPAEQRAAAWQRLAHAMLATNAFLFRM
jgi:hypothetical protein